MEVISKLRCIARHPFLLELTHANNLRKQNEGRLPYLPSNRVRDGNGDTIVGTSGTADPNPHPTGSSAIDSLLCKLNGLSLVGVETPCKTGYQPGNPDNFENTENSRDLDVDTVGAAFHHMNVSNRNSNPNYNPNFDRAAQSEYDEDEEAMLIYRCRSLPASASIFEMVGRTPRLEELMEVCMCTGCMCSVTMCRGVYLYLCNCIYISNPISTYPPDYLTT